MMLPMPFLVRYYPYEAPPQTSPALGTTHVGFGTVVEARTDGLRFAKDKKYWSFDIVNDVEGKDWDVVERWVLKDGSWECLE